MPVSTGVVTELLRAVRTGNVGAEHQLFELMYAELKRLARRYMRDERLNHTLQPTALVNEAYMRVLGPTAPSWHNRAHFLAYAAHAMRQILVDHARRYGARKRGGHHVNISLDDVGSAAVELLSKEAVRRSRDAEELIAIDEALTDLTLLDPRQARIVELHFFGGLSETDIATSLGLSERTVRRDWRTARLWLRRRIERGLECV